MKRVILAAAAIIVVVGACIWIFGSDREAEVIKQLSSLSNLIEKNAGENNMESLVKAKNISGLFDQNCSLTMPRNPFSGTYSPNEISALALKMRSGFTRVAVKFSDHDVTFPDDRTAEVIMLTKVKGEAASGKVDEILETKCRLRCVEDAWRFADFTVIESLKK